MMDGSGVRGHGFDFPMSLIALRSPYAIPPYTLWWGATRTAPLDTKAGDGWTPGEKNLSKFKGGAMANIISLLASVLSPKKSPTGTKPVGFKEGRSQMLPDQNRSAKYSTRLS